jgi:glucose/arabinose dehydrogenase
VAASRYPRGTAIVASALAKCSLIALLAALLAACTSSGAAGHRTNSPTGSPTRVLSPPSFPSPKSVPPLDVMPLRKIPAGEKGLPALRAYKIAEGNYPAGLAVAPDGRIFFTELWGGRIRVIDKKGRVSEWYDVNQHFRIEWTKFYHGGLTAITIDPDFESNHFVFAVTQVPSKRTGFAVKSLILRFKERNGHGAAPKVLLSVPAEQFDNVYSLVFGPDGTIFVPSGHESRPGVRDVPGDLVGEILHITRDGDPAGNPFGTKAPMTWAYGIRNSFDLAIEPETGYLVGGENGTEGHDEIDLIAPGRFYGWSKYEGVVKSAYSMTQPLLDFGAGHWAPVGMIRYQGTRFPRLRGLFLICMNHQPGVYAMRIAPGPPARLISFSKIAPTCSIDIAASVDGRIYVADPTAIYELK